MKVHLVDGTYELFRSYYGAPAATSPSGVEVGGTRGVLRTLSSLLGQSDVTHVAVAFDTVIESFRNDLFPGYKTSAGIDPALLAQFPIAERAAEALGVVVWRMIEFEADDALAAAADRLSRDPRVEQVVICTPDKDLAQCVRGQRVVALDRMRNKLIDEAGVIAKFGIPPASIPDYLALVGDTADGIPGIPRWGAKTAGAVLAHYKHIDAIPDDDLGWAIKVRGAAALSRSLREHRRELSLYRALATLRTDVPLKESLDDLAWTGAPRDELAAFCAELGDADVIGRVGRWR
jgi:5'-3' exonuclease